MEIKKVAISYILKKALIANDVAGNMDYRVPTLEERAFLDDLRKRPEKYLLNISPELTKAVKDPDVQELIKEIQDKDKKVVEE